VLQVWYTRFEFHKRYALAWIHKLAFPSDGFTDRQRIIWLALPPAGYQVSWPMALRKWTAQQASMDGGGSSLSYVQRHHPG
jgi:hypothetical protein